MSLTFYCLFCKEWFTLTQNQYMAEAMLSTLKTIDQALDTGEAVNPALAPVRLTCTRCGRKVTTAPIGAPTQAMLASQGGGFLKLIKLAFVGLLLFALCAGVGTCTFLEVRWSFWDPSDKQYTAHKDSRASVGVVFSPDGKFAASRSFDDIRVWDLQAGKEFRRFRVPVSRLGLNRGPEFSQDGALLMADADDGSGWSRPIAFRIQTGEQERNFKGDLKPWKPRDNNKVSSPDGKRELVRGDRAVYLKDAVTGKVLQTLKHYHNVHSMAISPDGRWALTTASDNIIRLWKLAP